MLQGQGSILQRIGKALGAQGDDITHDPMPTCWVDLILYVDEQERRCAERRHPEAGHACRCRRSREAAAEA